MTHVPRRDTGWGSDDRMPDRRSAQPRRFPAAPMPDRHSEGLRRQPQVRVEPEPEPALEPINPYAVVALVAALLGLFPVAIVFGLIALTYRGGRGLAIWALVLGVLEIITIIGVLVVGMHNSNSAAGSHVPFGPARSAVTCMSPSRGGHEWQTAEGL